MNIFSKKSANILPKDTRILKYAIELKENKQPFYGAYLQARACRAQDIQNLYLNQSHELLHQAVKIARKSYNFLSQSFLIA